MVGQQSASSPQSFASTAQRLVGDATAFKNAAVKKSPHPKKLVVGASTDNKHVKSVVTVRSVDIFVSRLHPATTDEELTECVNAMKGDIDVKDVVFSRLKSKYENLYTSYNVAIQVDSAVLKKAIDVFMSAHQWPESAFVKRFFRKHDGSLQ